MLGSFYRGYYLLNELLFGEISQFIEIVGVATDDPKNTFISSDKRVWQYPHSIAEAEMVENLALEHQLLVYKGRVNCKEFYEIFENHWRPNIALMATFGQRIGLRLINFPNLGFYNLHPCTDDKWPSNYIGGNPFNALIQDGHEYTRVAFQPNASVVDMHKITSFAAAKLASDETLKIIRNLKERENELQA